MLSQFINIDSIIVIAYLVATLVIGFKYGKNVKDITDYAVADRNYPDVVIMATIFATMIGGFATMGVAAKVHEIGIAFVIASSSWIIQNIISAFLVSKNFHKFKHCISLGDMVAVYYGKDGKLFAGIFSFLTIAGDISAQVMILGYLFEYLLGINLTLGIIIGASVVVIYSTTGGIRSVTATDLFQFGILIIAIPLVCSEIISNIGGYGNFIEKIPASHLQIIPEDKTFYIYMIPFFIAHLIPFYLEIGQRILISHSARQFKQSMLKVVAIGIPFTIIIALIGLGGVVLYPDIDSKDIIPHVIKNIVPVGFKGIVIAGLFSVVMSTTDSMLNTAAVSVSHDVIKSIFKKMQINYLFVARFVTAILGIASVIIALSFPSILDILLKVAVFWACTIKIPLFLGMLGLTINKNQFIVTVFGGLFSVIYGQIFLSDSLFSPLLLGMSVNTCLFLGFYLFSKFDEVVNAVSNVLINLQNKILKQVYKIQSYNYSNFTLNNIYHYLFIQSKKNAQIYYGEPKQLGFYIVVSFFFLVGNVQGEDALIINFIRSISGLLAFFLILHESWTEKFQKYFSIYWFFCLIYNLVFSPTISLFATHFNISWLINYGISILLLAIFTNWRGFLNIFIIGSLVSLALCKTLLCCYNTPLTIQDSIKTESILIYILSIIIIVFFFKKDKYKLEEYIKSLAIKLQISKGVVSEALQVRNNIFQNFTHEFNTPLQSISSLLEFSKEYDKFNPDTLKIVAKGAEKNMQSLKTFTEGITRVINNKTDKLREYKDFDLCNIKILLEEQIQNIYVLYPNTNINIKTEEENYSIICDHAAIAELIYQILENTISFGNKKYKNNEIDIILSNQAIDGQKYLNILINNININIDNKELIKIFEPLMLTSNITNLTERKGLSLAICDGIIAKHNGNIWIDSNKDKGVTVNIQLPYIPFEKVGQQEIFGSVFIDKNYSILYAINLHNGDNIQIAKVNTNSGIGSLELIKDNLNMIKIIKIYNEDQVPFLKSLSNNLEDKMFDNIKKVIID